jgi:hypothetical protein
MTSTANVFENNTNELREMTIDELDQVGGALAPVVAGFIAGVGVGIAIAGIAVAAYLWYTS